jgi:hypothetical protein
MNFINWNNNTGIAKATLYGIIFIISIIIIGKLYNLYKYDHLEDIESFESSISKFKSKQKRESMSNITSNNGNSLKNRLKQAKLNGKSKNKNSSRDITFDDVIKESESIDINKYTLSGLKNNFWDYIGSFKADKFTNITETNNEALDKLYIFRDKFFEIFE